MSEMNEVLEYLFFTRAVANEFTAKLKEHHLAFSEELEPVNDAIVLKIAEGVAEDLWGELDDCYDVLSVKDQAAMEATDENTSSTAGVYLQLAGGRQTVAQVDPDMVNRILSVLSVSEFNRFLEVVVQSVENPDDSAICQS